MAACLAVAAVTVFASDDPLVCCEIAAFAWISPTGKTASAPKATVPANKIDSPFFFLCIQYPPLSKSFITKSKPTLDVVKIIVYNIIVYTIILYTIKEQIQLKF